MVSSEKVPNECCWERWNKYERGREQGPSTFSRRFPLVGNLKKGLIVRNSRIPWTEDFEKGVLSSVAPPPLLGKIYTKAF